MNQPNSMNEPTSYNCTSEKELPPVALQKVPNAAQHNDGYFETRKLVVSL
jgi:hypothetical protein